MALSEIHKIDFITVNVQTRLDRRKARNRANWYSEPATAKQLAKLEYFGMPFEPANLTKGRASELIDCFTAIDPGREELYQNRPATPEQIDRLRSLGENESELTYAEARELISEKEGEEWQHLLEDDAPLMILENMLNDSDTLEICHYRELNASQLAQMLDYLNREHPRWQNSNRFDLGKLVPQLFPELRERNPKKGGSSLVLLLLLVAGAVFAVYKFGRTDSQPKTDQQSSATPESEPPALATPTPESTPVLTVEEWKRKAIAEYPQLAVSGSPFNLAFVARYKMYRGTSYFESSDWPMRLAKECAESVQGK